MGAQSFLHTPTFLPAQHWLTFPAALSARTLPTNPAPTRNVIVATNVYQARRSNVAPRRTVTPRRRQVGVMMSPSQRVSGEDESIGAKEKFPSPQIHEKRILHGTSFCKSNKSNLTKSYKIPDLLVKRPRYETLFFSMRLRASEISQE